MAKSNTNILSYVILVISASRYILSFASSSVCRLGGKEEGNGEERVLALNVLMLADLPQSKEWRGGGVYYI